MNQVRTISQQNLTLWRQQGRAVKQWLGYYFSGLDWLESYASQQNQCLNWIDASNVRLCDTPLLGTRLADITGSFPQEQSVAKTDVNKRASSVDDIRNARSVRFKQQDRKKLKRSAVVRMSDMHVKPDMHIKPAKSAESVSMARCIQTQASYTALRQWSNTQGPVYEVSDQTDPVHSFPADLQREKMFGSSNAFRRISSVDEKEWARKSLHRVKRMLAKEKEKANYNVDYTVVPDTIKTKFINVIKQGSLLPEQWKSVFQVQEISHELLMKIVSKTARISQMDINNSQVSTNNEPDGLVAPAFKGKHEHGSAMHQVLNRASFGSQRSDDRQHKRTPMTHRDTQPEFEFQQSPAFQDVSPAQQKLQQTVTSPYQLKTVANQSFENLLRKTKSNPAEIEKNDEELAIQIKRILDEEARRYGVDV